MQEVRSVGQAEPLDYPVPVLHVLHHSLTVDTEAECEEEEEGEGEGEGGLGGSHVSLSGGPS